MSAPTSRKSVGRPVSLPRAFANADLPVPGGPSRSTPRARTSDRRPGRRARVQNDLRASRPPRSAKVSPPRCSVSRPLFFSVWALSSQSTSGATRLCRTRQSEKAFSASTRVSPAAASSTAVRPSPSGSSPGSVATPRAIRSSWSRPGRSCSMTTNCRSSSTGICTTGAEDDDEGPGRLAGGDGRVEGLDDLDVVQEPVEVAEHQDRRAVGGGHRPQRPDGRRAGRWR